jgi:hypothetical protein
VIKASEAGAAGIVVAREDEELTVPNLKRAAARCAGSREAPRNGAWRAGSPDAPACSRKFWRLVVRMATPQPVLSETPSPWEAPPVMCCHSR